MDQAVGWQSTSESEPRLHWPRTLARKVATVRCRQLFPRCTLVEGRDQIAVDGIQAGPTN